MGEEKGKPTRVGVTREGDDGARGLTIPKSDASILATGDDVPSTGGDGNGEDVILVALKGLNGLGAPTELPDTDGTIQGAGDETIAIRGKDNAIDTVSMTLELLDQVT